MDLTFPRLIVSVILKVVTVLSQIDKRTGGDAESQAELATIIQNLQGADTSVATLIEEEATTPPTV